MKKVIYLAGGCFWGMERAVQMLNGIISTTTGYANGNCSDPTYKLVCTDTTEFRETVKVEYDSSILPLKRIIRAFFLCVDVTAVNRQGHDVGSQYQSGVYYVDANDRELLENCFEQERRKNSDFHVELKPLENFYDAEDYHQDYLIKNPNGYCHISPEMFDEVRKLNEEKINVYFAGSIRGGRQDSSLYHQMIEHLKARGCRVLTEHIGDLSLSSLESDNRDKAIYLQDTSWLNEADLLIGECTTPSLGVGYELGYAEKIGLPCHVLYDRSRSALSAMIRGDEYFRVYGYENSSEVFGIIDEILGI